MKEPKGKQIHLRVSDDQKEEIRTTALNNGYSNISKFIIDSILDNIKVTKPKEGQIIHTITVGPTIDYFINLEEFKDEGINKFYSSDKKYSIGGRGINTSLILKEFNIDNIAVHYSGGFTGEYLWKVLDEKGIKQHRIKSNNETRINLNVNDNNDKHFTIEQKSDPISEYGKEKILEYISSIPENDIVVLSGSVRNEDLSFLSKLIKTMSKLKLKFYVNLPGLNLLDLLGNSKPNFIVLSQTNSKKVIKTQKDIINFTQEFIDAGCKEVVYIDDCNYSIYRNKNNSFLLSTNADQQKSFVGLRDAFIAGMIANDSLELEEKLKWASACQKAKSLEQHFVSFNSILRIKKEVSIKKI